MKEIFQEVTVLNVDRLVETILGMNCFDDRLCCTWPQQDTNRVTGYRVDEDKGDQANPDKNRDHLNRAINNEFKTVHNLKWFLTGRGF